MGMHPAALEWKVLKPDTLKNNPQSVAFYRKLQHLYPDVLKACRYDFKFLQLHTHHAFPQGFFRLQTRHQDHFLKVIDAKQAQRQQHVNEVALWLKRHGITVSVFAG
ncbi:hypothetical protein [Thiomicrorhabdus sp.]|uniref:hypothetical protein n=1 Tax=Thiomicrorhabdus sp. TaxID=2039724 RepID=UPI0029C79DE7|nr:hypothetical protein [Thiomicrorhabdus sp.]